MYVYIHFVKNKLHLVHYYTVNQNEFRSVDSKLSKKNTRVYNKVQWDIKC